MSDQDPIEDPDEQRADDAAGEEEVRDGPMREEIIRMVVEALNSQGLPELTLDSVRADDHHRTAFIEMLQDCRPLPVVTQLIRDTREGRL